jgi:hypothetical protein
MGGNLPTKQGDGDGAGRNQVWLWAGGTPESESNPDSDQTTRHPHPGLSRNPSRTKRAIGLHPTVTRFDSPRRGLQRQAGQGFRALGEKTSMTRPGPPYPSREPQGGPHRASSRGRGGAPSRSCGQAHERRALQPPTKAAAPGPEVPGPGVPPPPELHPPPHRSRTSNAQCRIAPTHRAARTYPKSSPRHWGESTPMGSVKAPEQGTKAGRPRGPMRIRGG